MVWRGGGGRRRPGQVVRERDGRNGLAEDPGGNGRVEGAHRCRSGRYRTDTDEQGSAAHGGTPHDHLPFHPRDGKGTPQSFEITGDLTIKGRTRAATVHGEGNGDGLLRGWATITQSAWGIKPYTAFLGALRLADEVRIEFEVARLESAGEST